MKKYECATDVASAPVSLPLSEPAARSNRTCCSTMSKSTCVKNCADPHSPAARLPPGSPP
eukprot:6595201-Pyramimonas_sp.AAC.1